MLRRWWMDGEPIETGTVELAFLLREKRPGSRWPVQVVTGAFVALVAATLMLLA